MRTTIQDPIVTAEPGPGGENAFTETHPAYGQISVSRISGHQHLYGSDFTHQNHVRITVCESQLQRTLSRDWPFARGQIIELAMSEAQWATFVSSFNMGSGVQCTLLWREGAGYVPGLPKPDRTGLFSEEFKQDLGDIEGALKEALAAAQEATSGMSKAKAAVFTEKINKALRTVQSSIPFVEEQFAEHVEETVEKAKSEIHGYLGGQIQRAGLTALGATPTDVLKLEGQHVPKD